MSLNYEWNKKDKFEDKDNDNQYLEFQINDTKVTSVREKSPGEPDDTTTYSKNLSNSFTDIPIV